MNIIHITDNKTWDEAQEKGIYEPDALSDIDFIHCCLADQVQAVLAKWFKDSADLVALEIDPARLSSEVVYENLEGGRELFPHVYGPINLDAVLSCRKIGE